MIVITGIDDIMDEGRVVLLSECCVDYCVRPKLGFGERALIASISWGP
jgi:hypothetical protein